MQAAAVCQNCLIATTILHLASAHCFDADYSNRFCPATGDNTVCPCRDIPRPPPNPITCAPRHFRHTRAHVLFHCGAHTTTHATHLRGIRSLHVALSSKDTTLRLCTFLAATNSSLLHPLPVAWPSTDPP